MRFINFGDVSFLNKHSHAIRTPFHLWEINSGLDGFLFGKYFYYHDHTKPAHTEYDSNSGYYEGFIKNLAPDKSYIDMEGDPMLRFKVDQYGNVIFYRPTGDT